MPNRNGKPISIKKVRVYSPLKDPIALKDHTSKSTRKRAHKEHYLVNNAENYSIAIYEGVGKNERSIRSYKAFSNFAVTNGHKKVDDLSFDERFIPVKKNGALLEYQYEIHWEFL